MRNSDIGSMRSQLFLLKFDKKVVCSVKKKPRFSLGFFFAMICEQLLEFFDQPGHYLGERFLRIFDQKHYKIVYLEENRFYGEVNVFLSKKNLFDRLFKSSKDLSSIRVKIASDQLVVSEIRNLKNGLYYTKLKFKPDCRKI